MILTGLLILASGFFLMTLGSTPVVARGVRGLFGSYVGVILTIGVFVNMASGFSLTTHSLTIPSMRDDLGISYTQVGLLITVSGFVRMAPALIAGTLAPRYGSRNLIGGGTIVCGASMILLGSAPNYFTAVVGTALMGLGSEVGLVPMMGLVAPWFAIETRGLASGVLATGGSVAIISAGLIVPLLIDQNPADGWRNTWLIFGGFVVIIGIAAQVFLRDRPEEHSGSPVSPATLNKPRPVSLLTVFKNPWVWLLSYLAMWSGFVSGIFGTFFGAYLTDENGISLSDAGQLFLLVGVLSIFSGTLWGRVSDQVGRGSAFAMAFLVQGIGYALFWLIPVTAAFILASILIGLTIRASYTLCAAASGDHVPVNLASTAFAMMAFGASLGITISPTLAGAIADNIGISWVFALGVGGSLMGMVGALVLARSRARVQPAMAGPRD